jgi:hypothetical protein
MGKDKQKNRQAGKLGTEKKTHRKEGGLRDRQAGG